MLSVEQQRFSGTKAAILDIFCTETYETLSFSVSTDFRPSRLVILYKVIAKLVFPWQSNHPFS